MLRQGVSCGVVHEAARMRSGNPTKLLLRCQPWLDAVCQLYRSEWHDVRHRLGARNSHTCAWYAKYTRACAIATKCYDVCLPMFMKSNPGSYYDHIYPNRGPKPAAASSVDDY